MEQYKSLVSEIENAYEEGVSLDQAEKLAAKFLHAQIQLSEQLRIADLDARMRKSGVKAIRAAVYLDSVSKADKKPSDVMLEAIINTDELVQGEQKRYDESEVAKDELQNLFNIFKEAHIFFRGISKGRFE